MIEAATAEAPVPFPHIQQTLSCLAAIPLVSQPPRSVTATAIRDAKAALASGKSVGAYTSCQGDPHLRECISKFFQRRDGVAADSSQLFVNAGFRASLSLACLLLVASEGDAVLVCNPTARSVVSIVERSGGVCLYAALDEDMGDHLPVKISDTEEILRSFVAEHPTNRCRALFIADAFPNTPAGHEMRRDVLDLCARNGLVLIVDDSYQADRGTFADGCHSFRRINRSRSAPVELFSILSLSHMIKGGSMIDTSVTLVENVIPEVFALIVKLASISLCSCVLGQAALAAYLSQMLVAESPDEQVLLERQRAFDAEREYPASYWQSNSPRIQCSSLSLDRVALLTIQLPRSWIETSRRLKEKADSLFALRTEFLTDIKVVPGSLAGLEGEYGSSTIHLLVSFEHVNNQSSVAMVRKLDHAFRLNMRGKKSD